MGDMLKELIDSLIESQEMHKKAWRSKKLYDKAVAVLCIDKALDLLETRKKILSVQLNAYLE